MAITLVSRSPFASGVSPFLSTATAHTAGNLLVLVAQHQGGLVNPITSVTNSAGDTWQKTTSSPYWPNNGGSPNTEEIWYTLSTSGHAADVVTVLLNTASYTFLSLLEFDGGVWSFLADSAAANTTPSVITSGSLTLSGSSVIVAQLEVDNGSFTPGTGYTKLSPDGTYIYNEYHIVSVSEAATGTGAGGLPWLILAAAFTTVIASTVAARRTDTDRVGSRN